MDIVPIILGFMLAILLICVVVIAIYGAINIANGKHEWEKIGAILVPFVVFAIAFGIRGDSAEAGILTVMTMMGLLAVFVLFSGLRKTFKF
jgi:hypothetical protein